MAFDDQALKDYIDVAERVAEFHSKYPGGSLQPLDPTEPFKIREMTGTGKDGKQFTATFIIYTAAAYRSDGDPRPGIGVAWEVFPGRTPYTLGSELMNAETSAWGRALAALGVATRKGIASRQEVDQARERQNGAAQAKARNRPLDVPPAHLKRAAAPTTGAEQEQLRHGTVEATPDDRPAARVKAGQSGGPDPWHDQPPGDFQPYEPENRTGGIDSKQRGKIFKRFAELGVSTPTAQRAVLSDILHREVTTRAGLSYADAETVLKDLQGRAEAKEAAEEAALQDADAEATP